MKETRKQRIAVQKLNLHKQKNEIRIKKMRNVTTFAGASVLMGSAIAPSFSSGKAKAATEAVQNNQDQATTTNTSSSVVNNTTSSSVTSSAVTSSAQSTSSQSTATSQSTQQPAVKPQVTENEANKVASAQPTPTKAQPIVGVQSTSANAASARVIMSAASTSAQAFINSVASSARQLASDNNLYASVMIAQASLESGFGSSSLGKAPNYNLFGVKGSYNGSSVYMWTNEDDGHGNLYQIQAAFRKYPSYYQSLQDYVHVLKNTSFGATPYYQGAFKSYTSNYQQATQYLQGRYATATNYASSLNRLIQQYNLTQYDTPGSSTGNNNTGSTTTPTTPATGTKYTVKSGDSVWAIANKYGISTTDLISWNNIKNNMIHPGDVLIVSKTATGNGNSNSGNTGSTTTPTTPATGTKYTVKSGDSVWAIANKYGISTTDLISWNNIKNNMIHPGDVLIVSKSAAGSGNSNSGNTGSTTTPATGTKYTVKSGDSVWAIANKYGISMANLVKWNSIRNNFIYPGQVLVVSQSGSGSTSTGNTGSGSTTTNQTGKTYTVKSGDSVWAIANKSGISMATLVQLNNIKNNFIYPGQVLKLGSTTTSTSNSNQGTSTSKTYTVKSGDSLWSIAQKNQLSITQLKQINNLHSDLILVGQTLKLK
ncbi:muramidase family protein [Latilactobacillus fuchuensis]|uniref:Peptidoglycan hydrolase n=1 Tax=Latilactobacillus fuchuensis DSM 14340 = JCM 11249 TaxID=1423747 RepID=A0A0R1S5U8_9LACO|nr:LysM peptidoglycan-binding domain-containing protein [Latilactobacillus fuchuensis]KRL61781.1 muramidase-2 domain protein [Latilactobacillus fuchuensis DSM 14340 = JCM 11249]